MPSGRRQSSPRLKCAAQGLADPASRRHGCWAHMPAVLCCAAARPASSPGRARHPAARGSASCPAPCLLMPGCRRWGLRAPLLLPPLLLSPLLPPLNVPLPWAAQQQMRRLCQACRPHRRCRRRRPLAAAAGAVSVRGAAEGPCDSTARTAGPGRRRRKPHAALGHQQTSLQGSQEGRAGRWVGGPRGAASEGGLRVQLQMRCNRQAAGR
jgi:hypothetical protein